MSSKICLHFSNDIPKVEQVAFIFLRNSCLRLWWFTLLSSKQVIACIQGQQLIKIRHWACIELARNPALTFFEFGQLFV